MGHFVQYHNPEVMGRYRSAPKNFGIVTNKSFESLVGSTVWLITGSGRPRRYFLCSTFVVDKVERGIAGRFRNRAVGTNGQDLNVEVGEQPWFVELLKTSGNFGLGLLPLSNKTIIQGLQRAASSA